MRVIKISSGFIWDTVILQAEETEECFKLINQTPDRYIRTLAQRRIFINPGRKVRMWLPKSWSCERGDNIDISDLVNYLGERYRAHFNYEDTGKSASLTNRASSFDNLWTVKPVSKDTPESTSFDNGMWTTVRKAKEDV